MAVGSGRKQSAKSASSANTAGQRKTGAPKRAVELVGRDDALAAVAGAVTDGPALVVIEGEPGIGKTRLLREALAQVNGTKLVTACPAVREPFPLGAIVDGVRRLCDDVGAVGLSPLGGALRSQFPEWRDDLPPALEPLGDPKETQHRMLRALTELVERLGVELVVVEDVHWADSATLEWLLSLVASANPELPVVVTYRPWDVSEGSLLPRLTSRSPTGMPLVRVALEPLTVEQTRQLVASMFDEVEVSDEFAQFVHQRTGGVPLAVEESVLLMRDRHDITRHDGTWGRRPLDEIQVPASIRDSVLERVERLPPRARRILDAAAVLASPSDATTLLAVAKLHGDDGGRGLAAALRSGLLEETEPGRYAFRHALDAEAVGGAIPASERRTLHRRAGETLEKLDHPPVPRLARHFREANDAEKWCRYAVAAADLALEVGDDRTAVGTLLELLEADGHPADERGRLARKLGKAACAQYMTTALGSLRERVVECLEGVLASGGLSRRERGEIRLLVGRLRYTHETDVAVDLIESALPDLADEPSEAGRAMLHLGMPHAPAWPASRHLEWLDRLANLIPAVDSDRDRLSLTTNLATALLMLGEESGWQVAAEIPRTAPSASATRTVAHAMVNLAQMAITWGHYGDVGWRLELAIEAGRAHDYRRITQIAQVTKAYLDYHTGSWQDLTATPEDADSPETVDLEQLEASLLQGLIDAVQGDRQMADRRLRRLAEEFGRRGLVEPPTVSLAAGLGRIELAEGRTQEALATTEPVVQVIGRKGVWLWATEIAPVHLDALVATGAVDQAKNVVEQFADGLVGRNAPAPAAALVLCRAILAEHSADLGEAAELFGEAAQAWAALPRPYDELLALERRGRCLLANGHEDEALVVLSDTQQRLRELGARWDADRVAHLLREHGVEVARAWHGGRRGYGDQLSPRELEVVRLVAQGMTNRQAATALFLSRRTVDRHLSNAMRKLDVSSRTSLVLAAAEAGLLPRKTENSVAPS